MYLYAFAPSYMVLMLIDHIDRLRDVRAHVQAPKHSWTTQAPELTMRL